MKPKEYLSYKVSVVRIAREARKIGLDSRVKYDQVSISRSDLAKAISLMRNYLTNEEILEELRYMI